MPSAGDQPDRTLLIRPVTIPRVLKGQRRQQVAAALAVRFTRDRQPIRELAAEFDRRPSLVRRLLDEAGIPADHSTCLGLAEPEQAAALAARYRDGVSIDKLSADTGLDRRVVRRLVTQAGVRVRTHHPLPPDQTDSVISQYRAGATLRTLAERTGSSYSTIRRTLQRAGITRRPPGTRTTPPGHVHTGCREASGTIRA